jgi:chloride channel 3/4/5
MWRGFVTSVIAAVSLQYIDPFGTSKLVLFQVTGTSDTWKGFELVCALIWSFDVTDGTMADSRVCACCNRSKSRFTIRVLRSQNPQGVLGSLLIRLNAAAAVYRHNSALRDWPVLEVVGFTAITAAVSYLVRPSPLYICTCAGFGIGYF